MTAHKLYLAGILSSSAASWLSPSGPTKGFESVKPIIRPRHRWFRWLCLADTDAHWRSNQSSGSACNNSTWSFCHTNLAGTNWRVSYPSLNSSSNFKKECFPETGSYLILEWLSDWNPMGRILGFSSTLRRTVRHLSQGRQGSGASPTVQGKHLDEGIWGSSCPDPLPLPPAQSLVTMMGISY